VRYDPDGPHGAHLGNGGQRRDPSSYGTRTTVSPTAAHVTHRTLTRCVLTWR
jgi:hypothetical protein